MVRKEGRECQKISPLHCLDHTLMHCQDAQKLLTSDQATR